MSNKIWKIGAIFLTLLTPILLIVTEGFQDSLSDYWMTQSQPLFIFTNAVTAYYLFATPKWKIASVFLLLLTSFSVEDYRMVHNVFAILFFIACLFAILSDKRYRFYAIPLLGSLFWVGGIEELLVAEIIAVYTLCSYHATAIGHYLWVDYQRHKKNKLQNGVDKNI
jgi:hypothetical protein